MKRPYFDEHTRMMIRMDTYTGALAMFHLACKKLCREFYRIIKPLMDKIYGKV